MAKKSCRKKFWFLLRKRRLKKQKIKKAIEAEFCSYAEQNAEIEKARGKAELEKMKYSRFLVDWFFRL